MAYTKIGRIRPTYRGTWDAAAGYTALEIVQNAGRTAAWIAVRDVPAGTPLTDEEYWAAVMNVSQIIAEAEAATEAARGLADSRAGALRASVVGNPVTFYPDEGSALSPVQTFEPVQAGEGDPSPENIRPIAGYEGASLTRCGRNLFDADALFGSYKQADGSYRAQSNVFRNIRRVFRAGEVGNPVTISTHISNGSNARWEAVIGGASITGTPITGDGTTVLTVTPTGTNDYIRLRYADVTEVVLRDIQLSFGSVATEYEPYAGETFTADFGQTVCGGTLDWSAGVLRLDYGFAECDGTEAWADYRPTENTDSYFGFKASIVTGSEGRAKYQYASHLKSSNAMTSTGYWPNSLLAHPDGNLYIRVEIPGVNSVESWKAYLAAQHAAGTPFQVAYSLETPVEIPLTLPEIAGQAGLNTVVADPGSLTVGYNKSLAQAFSEVWARLNEG